MLNKIGDKVDSKGSSHFKQLSGLLNNIMKLIFILMQI